MACSWMRRARRDGWTPPDGEVYLSPEEKEILRHVESWKRFALEAGWKAPPVSRQGPVGPRAYEPKTYAVPTSDQVLRFAPDPKEMVEWMERHRVDITVCGPIVLLEDE